MSSIEVSLMNCTEQEQNLGVVSLIAPHGLGFGEGGITVKDQIKEGILTIDTPRHIHEILTHDSATFKRVEADDDGCGDGRPWTKIIQEDGQGTIHEYTKSLLRAKVFGGGMVTGASMLRTIYGAPLDGETVGQDRQGISEDFAAKEFKHGAHSDNHAEGDKCGCGAIDLYPTITRNAIKYRPAIVDTLRAVYGDQLDDNQAAINQAFDVYESLSRDEDYFSDADGKSSMKQILLAKAVVKELDGHHIEETIVLNDIPDTTLDQHYFTETVKNASTITKPRIVQAFCIDIWRGEQIADVVTQIALEEDPSRDAEYTRKLAYADFMIRTLAVAATLTAGDLPVYRRS